MNKYWNFDPQVLLNRTAILWDFDGVLYSYHTVPQEELHRNFWMANATGACELIPSLSMDEAYRIGGAGFLKYHDTISGFLPYASETGLEIEAFKEQLLAAQLRHSFINISQNLPQLIAPCAETTELFTQLRPYVEHVMITHAHRDHWAVPVARQLGVADYFSAMFGYAELMFQNKGHNAFAVEKAMAHLNAAPSQSIFIEDQPKHLEVAKAAYPDLLTVFIEGSEPIAQPDYVDLMVKRPKDFMAALLHLHQPVKTAVL